MKRFQLRKMIPEKDGFYVNQMPIAEGCLFSNGKISICWLGENSSMVFWDNKNDFENISVKGHSRVIVWLD